MRKVTLVATLLVGVAVCTAHPSWAQFKRYDYNWARMVPAGTLTLDGKANEPAWALAESAVVKYRYDAGIPGSGWKDEGGLPATDSVYAVFKFLTTTDNQLWIAATVRDSSIGGSSSFNVFDGLLMSLAQHQFGSHPAPAGECFVSWWWPVGSVIADPLGVDNPMAIAGTWRTPPTGSPATPPQQLAFDAAWSVKGHVNDDSTPDTSYTVEMRWDLPSSGYDALKAGGDIMEWNVSVYDADWSWPVNNVFRVSENRTWLQNPWGNTDWYGDYKLLANTSVTTSTTPLPTFTPDLIVPNLGAIPAPKIDGKLDDAAWANAPSFKIRYGDEPNRDTYPHNGPWRSGEFQAPVNGNGGTATIYDPTDCTVKYFYKADTLYLGMDFNDAVVQYHTLQDRWDGAIITLDDRVKRNPDNVLLDHHISFQVGPTGALLPQDELGYLRDSLHVVRAQLQLKPGTTVDTLGIDTDTGYTAELAIDLTAFGYTASLGDRAVYFGIEVIDGDSYSPITDSYSTHTFFFRAGNNLQNPDGPCVAYLDPNTYVTTAVGPQTPADKLELLGNYPNPFQRSTTIRYSLPVASNVTLEVYDLQGRLVQSKNLGVQGAGPREATASFTGRTGVYLYRMKINDKATGASLSTLSGKMMVLQ